MGITKERMKRTDESANITWGLVPGSYNPDTCRCVLRKNESGQWTPDIAACTSCIRIPRRKMWTKNGAESRTEFYAPDGTVKRVVEYKPIIGFVNHQRVVKGCQVVRDTNPGYDEGLAVIDWKDPGLWRGWKTEEKTVFISDDAAVALGIPVGSVQPLAEVYPKNVLLLEA